MERRKNKKRAITLIELVIAMAVAALLFGSCGFGLMRAMKAERFKAEGRRLISTIDHLRRIRAATLAVMDLHLEKVEGGVQGKIIFLSPLPPDIVDRIISPFPTSTTDELPSPLFFKGAKLMVDGTKGVTDIFLHFHKEGEIFPEISLYSEAGEVKVTEATSFFSKDTGSLYPREVKAP